MARLLKNPVVSVGFAPLPVSRWETGVAELRHLLLSAAMQMVDGPASRAWGHLPGPRGPSLPVACCQPNDFVADKQRPRASSPCA